MGVGEADVGRQCCELQSRIRAEYPIVDETEMSFEEFENVEFVNFKKPVLKEQLSNIQQLNFESLEKLNTLLGETHMMHTNNELRAFHPHVEEIKSKLSMIINAREDEGSTRSNHVY